VSINPSQNNNNQSNQGGTATNTGKEETMYVHKLEYIKTVNIVHVIYLKIEVPLNHLYLHFKHV